MLQASPMYAYIPARDMTRARQFYEGKLGFKPKEETAGGVVYEFGRGTACFLYPTPNAGTSQASQAFWSVDDVDGEMTALKARGVAFEDYAMPGEKSAAGAITAGGAKAGGMVQGQRRKHHGADSNSLDMSKRSRPLLKSSVSFERLPMSNGSRKAATQAHHAGRRAFTSRCHRDAFDDRRGWTGFRPLATVARSGGS